MAIAHKRTVLVADMGHSRRGGRINRVKRCVYEACLGAVDGWFLLAPGCEDLYPWPEANTTVDEAVPLCQWHALLVGDRRVVAPTITRP
jgi:hypothetical protein